MSLADAMQDISLYNMDATTIVVATIGFLGVFVGAWFGYLGQRHARQINDAVNHRHTRGGEAPKLYDLAWENHQKLDSLAEWKQQTDGRLMRIENSCIKIEDSCSE